MNNSTITIKENESVAESLFRMVLCSCEGAEVLPGQFINIKLGGKFLRRPISVHDYDAIKDELTIIYKVVGEGTEQMSRMNEGEKLETLLPLGNGFNLKKAGDEPLLIGGGVGTAPLYYLARSLAKQGTCGTVIMGFNKESEIFSKDDFEAIGFKTIVTTADGSFGVKGFVTDAMDGISSSYAYVCGPEPMMKAVYKKLKGPAEFSFEARMGCGFGACMGCSCQTIAGYKRICKDGPVMRKEELIWED